MKKIRSNLEDWANHLVQSSIASLNSNKTNTPDAEAAEERACSIFDRVFSQTGTGRASVMTAFEGSLEELAKGPEREDRLREISKAAALSTARSHGNIIETGRILLGNIDELGAKLSLDVRRCKDQVMLGLAEGACQVGPIVYGRFLDIASEYRDNADEWIVKNKRRSTVFESSSLPVIVPFEAELTLSARPFKDSSAAEPPAAEAPQPAAGAKLGGKDQPDPVAAPEVALEACPGEPAETTPQWSRPKGKGFFQRLSDVMGSFFGRG